MHFHDILKKAVDKKASDVHIVANRTPIIRIDGELIEITEFPVLSASTIREIAIEMLDDLQEKRLEENKESDVVYQFDDTHRFRTNVFSERGNLSIVARLIPDTIPTLEELGFNQKATHFTQYKDGLILLTGPTGHGKSTTLAAMVQHINQERTENIITLEDPIEFVFPRGKAIIKQRQFGSDFVSFSESLKYIVRHDPDIIVVGEMRDPETIATTITLAETGHLVFSSLHTVNAGQTIHRILDMFSSDQKEQIRLQLAITLRAVISQRLIPKTGGNGGRVAAREILVNTPAIANLIRNNKLEQIPAVLQTSSDQGMITMDQHLISLVQRGTISKEDAIFYMVNPELLDANLAK